MVFLIETIQVTRRDMSLAQLLWRQIPQYLYIDAMATGNTEEPLHLARHRSYALRIGVYQTDARGA